MKTEGVSYSEGFALVTVCIITKMFLGFLPDAVFRYGPSSPYVSIIAGLLSISVFIFVKRERWNPGKISGIILYVYFILYFAMNLRETVRVIKIYNFQLTPAIIFSAVFLLVASVIVFSGKDAVTRLSSFYVKIIIGVFVIIFLLGLGQYDTVKLAPIGGYGMGRITEGIFTQLTLYLDVFLLFLFAPDDIKIQKKSGISALLVSLALIAISFASYIMVFDYTVSESKTSGLIEIVKNVYYGHLFQRMESIFFLVMVVSAGVSVCIWLFGAVKIYSGVFGIKDNKQLLFPTALLVLCLSGLKLDTLYHLTGKYGGLFVFSVLVVSEVARRVKSR